MHFVLAFYFRMIIFVELFKQIYIKNSKSIPMSLKIKQKNKYGDYEILAQCLGISLDAARMRYYRKDKEALKIMSDIQANREKFILKYSTSK